MIEWINEHWHKACILMACMLLSALAPGFAQSVDSATVYGEWLTGDATVEIRDCSDGTPCGYIIKVDAQASNEDILLDVNNPDKTLRGNPLVGTLIVHGFRLRKNRWRAGKIYNPANGKSYASSLQLETPTLLLVKGCIGPFCQTQEWIRSVRPEASEG